MKKWFALSIVAVLTVLAVATVVSAQAPQPQQTPQPYGQGLGWGMMGQGRQSGVGPGGMMGGLVDGDEGPLHDGMIAYFAGKLGLSVEAVEARLEAGETMWQIAQSQNVAAADFAALMQDARNAGIDAAVQAGLMTQAQADWMKQRSQIMPMFQEGFYPGDCPMYGGSTAVPQAGFGMQGGRGGMGGRWSQAPANTVTQ
jgi:hypothetical protein